MDECYLPQANIIHLILQNQSVLTTFLYFYSVLSEMNTKVFSKGNMYSWLQTHLVVQNVSSMKADNCSCLPTAHTQAKLPCYTLSSSPSSFHLAQGLFWSRGEREREEEELTHTWALTTNCITLAYCASVKATENLGPSPWGVPQWRGLNGGHSWWCIQFTHLNELTNLASMHSREAGRS